MLSIPELVQTEAQTAAVVPLKVPRSGMMKAFGPAVGELMATLAEQGVKPDSAVFAHHLRMSPDEFDFELGVRVAAPIQVAGRVRPGELPAARVARAVYSGPYEGLPAAWNQLMAWIEAQGHQPAGDLWEVYSVGPQATPDPTGWRTELNRPLKGA